MWEAKKTNPTGLIIPVDVAVACVGSDDARKVTNNSEYFSGTMTWFEDMTGDNEAFLGANVTRSLSEPPLSKTALEKGVHLHWALPDALTRVNVKSGDKSLKFPAVPNRWLVTRFIIDGKNPAPPTSWIVENDILLDEESIPQGQKPITLPVRSAGSADPGCMYCGLHKPFDANWTEPVIPKDKSFKTLTGAELSTVSNGVISFAAFYPNSRSVFGFVDELTGVTQPIQLMYVIFGWFSNAANDPLNGTLSLEEIRDNFRWTFTGNDKAKPGYTLYHGMVQDIAWDPKSNYFPTNDQPKTVNAEVAIGNSPAEALSAYFQDQVHPGIKYFQVLFNAFQTGILSKFIDSPLPDQLARLEESLHTSEFSPRNAGKVYTVVKKETKSPGKPGGEVLQREITLPLPLANDLNLLNIYQQQADFCQFHIDNFRWQLFSDWYRIFKATGSTQSAANLITQYKISTWEKLQGDYKQIQGNLSSQYKKVTGQLGNDFLLKAEPAARCWQPNEPVVVVVSDDILASRRYGGDGGYHPDQYLVCRLTTQTLTAVSINSDQITASQFTNAKLPAGNKAPQPALLDALLQEACLLNTQLAAAITGNDPDTLMLALEKALSDAARLAQDSLTYKFTGNPPSPVTINWWQGNPWLPFLMQWTVNFQPLLDTEQNGKLQDYSTGFFTDNYQVDQNQGGFIQYKTDAKIHIDPTKAAYNQEYVGLSILNTRAADNLEKQLSGSSNNDTLTKILHLLKNKNIFVQSLSGFNDRLLMREQSPQLPVQASSSAPQAFKDTTIAANPLIGDMNHVSPDYNGHFNPIRAGYLKLSLTVVGAYGEKREVDITGMVCAESMTAYKDDNPVPSVAALTPRLAQQSRLLFRWLAANSTNYDEMNAHPASSPVCGWIMPNHLDGSLFLYNQQGRSLGTLYLSGDERAVLWQSAPGDNQTVNQPLPAVLSHANPQLSALATRLAGDANFFKGFWRAIDSVNAFINPHQRGSNSNLAVLVGRPLALVQTSLRLEAQGPPAINQAFATLDSGNYIDDNGFSSVQFPVIIGDLKQMNDGLIGYFKQKPDHSGYDMQTFYSEGADSTDAHVVTPGSTNILLSLTPKISSDPKHLDVTEPPENQENTEKLLMLVDPRAQVHATMGILPTQSIDIPPDQYAGILSTLEMTFLSAPILRPTGGLTLPLPKEEGYEWSWVEEDPVPGSTKIDWIVDAAVDKATGNAVWNYTPQILTEGWLRLNPQLLEFRLLNPDKHPLVMGGQANKLTLNITNKKGSTVTFNFNAGQLKAEGEISDGSIFYIHFSHLVADKDILNIQLSAPGWRFKLFNDPRYGNYWAAAPADAAITVHHNKTITIDVENVVALSSIVQAYVYFDYYNVDGLQDGVFDDLIAVQQPGKH